MNIGKREIGFFVLMIALLAGSYHFGFSKLEDRRTSLRQEIARRQGVLDDLSRSTRDIADIEARTTALAKAIDFFEARLPREKEVADILRRVTDMAEAQHLASRSFVPMKVVVDSNYRELPIDITFSGNFSNFYSFMLQLEQMPRITQIQQMTLRKIDDRDGEMQADLRLSIFFESADSNAAPIVSIH